MDRIHPAPSVAAKKLLEFNSELQRYFSAEVVESRVKFLEDHSSELKGFILELILKFKEDKDVEGIATSYHLLSMWNYILKDDKNAKAKKMISQKTLNKVISNDHFYRIFTQQLHELGIVLFRMKNYPKAKKYFKKSLVRYSNFTSPSINLPEVMADCHYRLGAIARSERKDKDMKEHFMQAVDGFKGIQSQEKKVAEMSYEIGVIYFSHKKWKLAEEYLVKSARLHEKAGQLDMVAKAYGFLGEIRKKEKLTDEAEKYFEKVQQLKDKQIDQVTHYKPPPVNPEFHPIQDDIYRSFPPSAPPAESMNGSKSATQPTNDKPKQVTTQAKDDTDRFPTKPLPTPGKTLVVKKANQQENGKSKPTNAYTSAKEQCIQDKNSVVPPANSEYACFVVPP